LNTLGPEEVGQFLRKNPGYCEAIVERARNKRPDPPASQQYDDAVAIRVQYDAYQSSRVGSSPHTEALVRLTSLLTDYVNRYGIENP